MNSKLRNRLLRELHAFRERVVIYNFQKVTWITRAQSLFLGAACPGTTDTQISCPNKKLVVPKKYEHVQLLWRRVH